MDDDVESRSSQIDKIEDAESRRSQIDDIEDGIFEEEILLENIIAAYISGALNDVRIICSDGIQVPSNRNFLAIRVPFFSKMFFGSFQSTVQDEVEFKSCDSETFTFILNYIWKGSLVLKHLPFSTLLNIMETSRFLCIDSLSRGIESHLIRRILGGKVLLCECLDALEFAASNNFDKLLRCLFVHMYRRQDTEDAASKFESLTMVAVMSLLMVDFDEEAIEDFKFEIFLYWIKKNEVDPVIERKMLDAFDLRKFSSLFLLKKVQKSEYFKDEDIFSILIRNVTAYEAFKKENSKLLHEKDMRINLLENRLATDLVNHGKFVRAAEACAATMAGVFPLEMVVRRLNQIVETGDFPVNEAAIKMLTKVIEKQTPDSIEVHLAEIMPGLLKAYDNVESSVRKAAVFCIVSLHQLVGETVLQPHLDCLYGLKMKLLSIYIMRAQAQSNAGSPRMTPS